MNIIFMGIFHLQCIDKDGMECVSIYDKDHNGSRSWCGSERWVVSYDLHRIRQGLSR